ncbi:hypothetical protein KDK_09970 [Dictyobacter kobayashii]|uniref:Uncharacterized protein n=2 Tax=Dictyobacter kobayashii TaxID=2014872 RepID=A0A402ADL1_9CHLR|nr:hypothetical protein KDK_09970 [Dictyobacter kobayashii]
MAAIAVATMTPDLRGQVMVVVIAVAIMMPALSDQAMAIAAALATPPIHAVARGVDRHKIVATHPVGKKEPLLRVHVGVHAMSGQNVISAGAPRAVIFAHVMKSSVHPILAG